MLNEFKLFLTILIFIVPIWFSKIYCQMPRGTKYFHDDDFYITLQYTLFNFNFYHCFKFKTA